MISAKPTHEIMNLLLRLRRRDVWIKALRSSPQVVRTRDAEITDRHCEFGYHDWQAKRPMKDLNLVAERFEGSGVDVNGEIVGHRGRWDEGEELLERVLIKGICMRAS